MQRMSDYYVQQETIFVSQQRGNGDPASQSDPAEKLTHPAGPIHRLR